MTPLQRWCKAASASEKKRLAELAGTAVNYIDQLNCGARHASAEMAGKLAAAAELLRQSNPRLPVLRREHLADACRGCEYVKACRKGKRK